jgi:D-alanyl-D-alanine endopeptidase (penicillin-binding protein 7)
LALQSINKKAISQQGQDPYLQIFFGETMARKFTLIILLILLMGSILVVQDVLAFSKSSKSRASHRHHVSKKIHRAHPKLVLHSASASRASHRHCASGDIHQIPVKLVLHSSSALVEDQQTSESLIQKNADAVMPIASITKLMTAMVVLDAKMDLQESLVIESEDVDTLRHSHSRLPVGTHITRQEALLLALMASENRAAHVLSRTDTGGQDAFVAAMNAKARSLGLAMTRFTDPTGLYSGNVSSAHDLAKMVDAAYNYPLIREFTTRKEAIIQSDHHRLAFHNTNRLVRNPRWQIGLSKTGFIDEAGRCLVMQAQVARHPVLIVLLDAQGSLTRFDDANRIKQWMERQPPPQITRKG